ncbi:MAG: phosphotransferase family protein [Vulcanimicrobiota bacterium]
MEVARLEEYLGLGPLCLERFGGGYSNLTYRLSAGDQEWVLRTAPPGSQVVGGHDMGREYRILSALHPVFPKVPRPWRYCADESVLGRPFFLMELVQGEILRGRNGGEPDRMARISRQLVAQLVQLHSLDVDRLGLREWDKGAGYIQRQVSGWVSRWHKAEGPGGDRVLEYLAASQPAPSPACLIHNDFKYDNVVLRGDEVVAILDWEMATVGDPWMDLGTSLGYWVEAGDAPELQALGFGPTHLPGNLTRREFSDLYQQLSGHSRTQSDIDFFYVFGLFKVAVIAQQIFLRFRQGHTRDQRFAGLDRAVSLLLEQATRVI